MSLEKKEKSATRHHNIFAYAHPIASGSKRKETG